MKKLIILTLTFAFVLVCFGQQTAPKEYYSENEYYKKSRNQKTAAWVLTGVGTLGLAVTAGVDAAQTVGGEFTTLLSLGTVEPEHKSYTVPYLLSAACIASGVCLFIGASKNKKKATDAAVFIGVENAPVIRGTVVITRSFPSVGIKMSL
jgi:hypothetical protein